MRCNASEVNRVVRALVLAAGEGRRMDNQPPKQLCQVGGLSLLERVLSCLRDAGIEEVHMVLGYEAELIQEWIGKSYAGLSIQYIYAEQWPSGNLHSFLAAQDFSNQDFILCMSDHIFEPEIVRKLRIVNLKGTVSLAVDRVQQSPDDTLVLERNGEILDIGKRAVQWNCVDTGFFRCTSRIFEYAVAAAEAGGTELAECMKLAAAAGEAHILDVSGHYWVDVDVEEDVKRAKRILAHQTQKGRGASDLIAHYINRPIENALVYHLSDTRISPNMATLASNILAYLAAAAFLFGFLLWGSLLTFVVGVVDGIDGKLARMRRQTTRLGKLEHAFDLLFEFTWLLALAVYLSTFWGPLPILLTAVSITLMAFYRMVYDLFGRITGVSLDNYGSFEQRFRRVAGRRNLYNVHILVGVLLGIPLLSLFTITLHACVTAGVYVLRAGMHLHAADRST
ncbi:MAG: NTP transferase domain-containing protein [Candidatus Thorarchaeota archaeon]